MKKRGQEVTGISFGMIISIIIIIAIVAVSVYAINHMRKVSQCSQVSLFYEDIKNEVSEAWTHGGYKNVYEGKLPSSGILSTGVKEVCFGNLTIPAPNYGVRRDYFRDEMGALESKNIFMYPAESACSSKFYSYELKCNGSPCVNFPEFFCVNVTDGKVPVTIEKASTDRRVTIKP
jgi:hypothetical protein